MKPEKAEMSLKDISAFNKNCLLFFGSHAKIITLEATL